MLRKLLINTIIFLISLTSNVFTANTEEWYLRSDDSAVELYVYEVGQGEPVVVLHGGFGAEHSYLLDAVNGLESKYRFVFYDQRGSLRSPCKSEFVSIDKHIQDLESLRKELGLAKITIFAHSIGTYLAMQYLQKYPDRVKNLILTGALPPQSGKYLDPSTLPTSKENREAFLKFAERPEKIAELEKIGHKQPNLTAKQKTDIWRINFAAVNIYHIERWKQMKGGRVFYNQEAATAASKTFSNDYDFTKSLINHPYPITLINGDHDFADFRNFRYKRFALEASNIKLVIIKNAGHNAWIDSPTEFMGKLDEAINKK